MTSPELLSEIQEIKEKLAKVEAMLRFIIERSIEEAEPLPDEIEAVKSEDELVDLDEIKQKLTGSK